MQVVGVGEVDAAFALQHFEHDGDDVVVVLADGTDRGQVVEGDAHETGDERLETRLRLAVAGCRQRRQRAPVERMFHDDDVGAVDVALVSVEARELDRRLVRLGAGVAEEHFVHAGQCGKAVGQFFRRRNAIEVGRVQQARRLPGDRSDQRRVIVAQRIDGDPGERVEVAAPLAIGDPASLTVSESHRQAGIGIHQVRHKHPLV